MSGFDWARLWRELAVLTVITSLVCTFMWLSSCFEATPSATDADGKRDGKAECAELVRRGARALGPCLEDLARCDGGLP